MTKMQRLVLDKLLGGWTLYRQSGTHGAHAWLEKQEERISVHERTLRSLEKAGNIKRVSTERVGVLLYRSTFTLRS